MKKIDVEDHGPQRLFFFELLEHSVNATITHLNLL